MLIVTALCTALASWIGSLHGGNQATNYAKSKNLAAEGISAYNSGVQQLTTDMGLWNDITDMQLEFLFVQDNGDDEKVEETAYILLYKIQDNLSDDMAARIDWNLDLSDAEYSDPVETISTWLNQDNAMVSPFSNEEFIDSYFETANEAVRFKSKSAMAFSFPMVILLVFTVLELNFYSNSPFYSSSPYFLTGAFIFGLFLCGDGAYEIRQSVYLKRKEADQEYKLQLLNRELSEQQKYQNAVVAQEENLRRMRHDYRHPLTVLKAYAEQKDGDGFLKYIDNLLLVTHPTEVLTSYCSNMPLNAVISYYSALAEKQDVDVDIEVSLPDTLSLDFEKELRVIIGNLLENANEIIRRIEK